MTGVEFDGVDDVLDVLDVTLPSTSPDSTTIAVVYEPSPGARYASTVSGPQIAFVGVWAHEQQQTRRRRLRNWLLRRGSTAKTVRLTEADVERIEQRLREQYGVDAAIVRHVRGAL